MSRDVPAAILSILRDPFVLPVFFVELQFDSGTVYLHTDLGDIVTLSNTWTGTGDLGDVGDIDERDDGTPTGVTLSLSGIDSTLADEALNQNHYQRPAIIYLSFRDIVTGALVADPFQLFSGKINTMPVVHNGPESAIKVNLETDLIMLKQSPLEYYSNAQLQKEFPGDLFFEYLIPHKNRRLKWGEKDNDVELGLDLENFRPSFPFPG